MENFKIDIDADGIALVVFDVPGKSMNTLDPKAMSEMAEIAERLKTDETIHGAVIASGKASGFCAGADLRPARRPRRRGPIWTRRDRSRLRRRLQAERRYPGHRDLRQARRAAIKGLALGGGFEMTLGCHYRVVGDNPRSSSACPRARSG